MVERETHTHTCTPSPGHEAMAFCLPDALIEHTSPRHKTMGLDWKTRVAGVQEGWSETV